MDSIHFGIRSGRHGAATQHIAYITREGSHAKRNDLISTGHGNMPPFANDQPRRLWKASDQYERKNGSTFRAYTISLPRVLSIEQLSELALRQARRLAGPKAFQWALHMPRSSLRDEPHPHVHVAICDRLPDGIDRPPEQMFRRYNPANPSKGGCRKDSGGKTRKALNAHLMAQREAAAEEINAALAKHGHHQRVDHRTLRERGIDRPPERYLGPARIRTMTKEERASYMKKEREQHSAD